MKSSILEEFEGNEYLYRLTKSYEYIDEAGITAVYGIAVCEKGGRICSVAQDVSVELDTVRRLCRLIAQEELYPEHLLDVVEDMIG